MIQINARRPPIGMIRRVAHGGDTPLRVGAAMYCESCGARLPGGAAFCPSCGRALRAPESDGRPASASPPAAVPARRRHVLTKLLIGFVLLVAAAYGLVTMLTDAMVGTVDRHFAALARGDFAAAHAEFSAAARQATSEAALRATVAANPSLARVVGHSFPTRKWENGEGVVEGTLDLVGGGTLPVSIRLVEENGDWKILGYHTR